MKRKPRRVLAQFSITSPANADDGVVVQLGENQKPTTKKLQGLCGEIKRASQIENRGEKTDDEGSSRCQCNTRNQRAVTGYACLTSRSWPYTRPRSYWISSTLQRKYTATETENTLGLLARPGIQRVLVDCRLYAGIVRMRSKVGYNETGKPLSCAGDW